jgi:hypothetical protein
MSHTDFEQEASAMHQLTDGPRYVRLGRLGWQWGSGNLAKIANPLRPNEIDITPWVHCGFAVLVTTIATSAGFLMFLLGAMLQPSVQGPAVKALCFALTLLGGLLATYSCLASLAFIALEYGLASRRLQWSMAVLTVTLPGLACWAIWSTVTAGA